MPDTNIFSAAPEVRAVAEDLIKKHHRHLLSDGVRIDFLFRSKPQKKLGKVELGTARKVSSLAAYLASERMEERQAEETEDEDFKDADDVLLRNSHGSRFLSGERFRAGDPFFVITIWQGAWNFALDERQKKALTDHELCHLMAEEAMDKQGNETLKLSLLPHDLEEFNAVVRRHGMWLDDVEKLVKAAQDGAQLSLGSAMEAAG